MNETTLESYVRYFRKDAMEAQNALIDGDFAQRYRHIRAALRMLVATRKHLDKLVSIFEKETEAAYQTYRACDDYDPFNEDQYDLLSDEEAKRVDAAMIAEYEAQENRG